MTHSYIWTVAIYEKQTHTQSCQVYQYYNNPCITIAIDEIWNYASTNYVIKEQEMIVTGKKKNKHWKILIKYYLIYA